MAGLGANSREVAASMVANLKHPPLEIPPREPPLESSPEALALLI